jgi:hypothetical protein
MVKTLLELTGRGGGNSNLIRKQQMLEPQKKRVEIDSHKSK